MKKILVVVLVGRGVQVRGLYYGDVIEHNIMTMASLWGFGREINFMDPRELMRAVKLVRYWLFEGIGLSEETECSFTICEGWA
jgi:hypothetical protein